MRVISFAQSAPSKGRACLLISVSMTLLGCSRTVHLYPVQGPLSAQLPVPVIAARMTGEFTPGNLSAVLSDGELCKGRFKEVPRVPVSQPTNPVNQLTESDVSSMWDAVYGSGFYVAHVLGARYYARALVSGNRGSMLHVEIYRPENVEEGSRLLAAIKGVVRDSKGNIYKVVF